jgi:ubiquinone/menaquinone biosynthesis C-methylase UbiE
MRLGCRRHGSFRDMERKGWEAQAAHYHDRLAQMTQHAAAYMLAAVGAQPRMRLLDICCGPGHISAEAAARGLAVLGIDIAPAMISEASRRFPNIEFRLGDAEALDLADGSFDAAICAFGLLHLPEPDRGIAEAFRVLRAGGRYAFSVWCAPQKAKLFGLLIDAVMAHADPSISLPPAPPMFQFSDQAVSLAALERAGFRDVTTREIPITYHGESPNDVVDWFERSTVRSSALYNLQAPDVRRRIRDAIVAGARRYAEGGEVRIPCSAVMFAARKPE